MLDSDHNLSQPQTRHAMSITPGAVQTACSGRRWRRQVIEESDWLRTSLCKLSGSQIKGFWNNANHASNEN